MKYINAVKVESRMLDIRRTLISLETWRIWTQTEGMIGAIANLTIVIYFLLLSRLPADSIGQQLPGAIIYALLIWGFAFFWKKGRYGARLFNPWSTAYEVTVDGRPIMTVSDGHVAHSCLNAGRLLKLCWTLQADWKHSRLTWRKKLLRTFARAWRHIRADVSGIRRMVSVLSTRWDRIAMIGGGMVIAWVSVKTLYSSPLQTTAVTALLIEARRIWKIINTGAKIGTFASTPFAVATGFQRRAQATFRRSLQLPVGKLAIVQIERKGCLLEKSRERRRSVIIVLYALLITLMSSVAPQNGLVDLLVHAAFAGMCVATLWFAGYFPFPSASRLDAQNRFHQKRSWP